MTTSVCRRMVNTSTLNTPLAHRERREEFFAASRGWPPLSTRRNVFSLLSAESGPVRITFFFVASRSRLLCRHVATCFQSLLSAESPGRNHFFFSTFSPESKFLQKNLVHTSPALFTLAGTTFGKPESSRTLRFRLPPRNHVPVFFSASRICSGRSESLSRRGQPSRNRYFSRSANRESLHSRSR